MDEFPPRSNGADGHRCDCRGCYREHRRKFYSEHLEQKREEKKRYEAIPENKIRRQGAQRKLRARQKEEGRCNRCGDPTEVFGHTYCQSCTKKKNKRSRERLIERGCCVRCGSKMSLTNDNNGKKTCVNCRDKVFYNCWG